MGAADAFYLQYREFLARGMNNAARELLREQLNQRRNYTGPKPFMTVEPEDLAGEWDFEVDFDQTFDGPLRFREYDVKEKKYDFYEVHRPGRRGGRMFRLFLEGLTFEQRQLPVWWVLEMFEEWLAEKGALK